jgi:hypothetical protein
MALSRQARSQRSVSSDQCGVATGQRWLRAAARRAERRRDLDARFWGATDFHPPRQSGDCGLTGRARPLYSAGFAALAFGECRECPCGGIGRRARLKIEFRKECWFDSGQGHQLSASQSGKNTLSRRRNRHRDIPTRRAPANGRGKSPNRSGRQATAAPSGTALRCSYPDALSAPVPSIHVHRR